MNFATISSHTFEHELLSAMNAPARNRPDDGVVCTDDDAGVRGPYRRYVFISGYETWSLILKEERRLGVFQNRVLRRIFGQKMDEMAGDW
jgi:hypothetical protein